MADNTFREPVELLELLAGQLEADGAQVLVDAFRAAGSRDRGDAHAELGRLRVHPGDGDLGDRDVLAVLLAQLLRDGREIATATGTALEVEIEEPGGYRVEALRHAKGRERTWILSNPIYLRA